MEIPLSKRKFGILEDFLKSLEGKTINIVDNYILFIGNELYYLEPNETFSGGSNGSPKINIEVDYLNKDIFVDDITIKCIENSDNLYKLIINDELVGVIDTGWGNGYYGGDFKIIKIK